MKGSGKTSGAKGNLDKTINTPPGVTINQVYRGHAGRVTGVAWSPDGLVLATASRDCTIRLWAAGSSPIRTLEGHSAWVRDVAWSPDGLRLASASDDRTVRLWDAANGRPLIALEGHGAAISNVTWSPDGLRLASASDDRTVRLWDAANGRPLMSLEGHLDSVRGVNWSSDGLFLASVSGDRTVRLWDAANGRPLMDLEGHGAAVFAVVWSPIDRTLASASGDGTLCIWDADSGQLLRVLEGHVGRVTGVAWSPDGQMLASASTDGTVRLWRCNKWDTVTTLPWPKASIRPTALAFHPRLPQIATLGASWREICIWDYDIVNLLGTSRVAPVVHHIMAKIVLVGDSGVGKTGLGWRLAHGTYRVHDSTHGQQFWVPDLLKHRRIDGVECEAVLWDLAGQPDYRLIHALFLDDADLALVLFNPANRHEPLHGVDYWLRALAHGRERPCRTLLVGARIDVGEPSLTGKEINDYCRDRRIQGGYVGTSAKRGDGLAELVTRIQELVGWDTLPVTVTTPLFKHIKDYVLDLRESQVRAEVLVDPVDLRRKLQEDKPELDFSDDEMMTAVSHLANAGYVRLLRTSEGERRIVRAPDLLNNLAASIVLRARQDEKDLGALDEGRLLRGEYTFPELAGISESDRLTLLEDATALFLERNICFRETNGPATYLIFPELINQSKPRLDVEFGPEDDVSYSVSGDVANAYAALVVLIGYTNLFIRIHQWKDQAHYMMGDRDVCGFRQQLTGFEGEAEFVLYYGQSVDQSTRDLFRGLFERFLLRRRVQVTRYPSVICPNRKCGYRQGREEVIRQIRERSPAMFCSKCGRKIIIAGVGEVLTPGRIAGRPIEQERATADMRTTYESALVSVKSLARKKRRKKPACFISYAWGDSEHAEWVEKSLSRDLQNAGVEVLLDRWHNASIGSSVTRFIALLENPETFVVIVGTPAYRQKYENANSPKGSVVAAEVDLINVRSIGTELMKSTVLPLVRDGDDRTSLPPLMLGRTYADFREESSYFKALFDLVLTLHGIPFESPTVAELRHSLDPDSNRF